MLIDEYDLNKILSPQEMTKPAEIDIHLANKIKNGENYRKFLENL